MVCTHTHTDKTLHTETYEYAFALIEAASGNYGTQIIDRIHTISCGNHKLEAVGPTIHGQASAKRQTHLPLKVTPELQFYRRPDVGTIDVVDITTGFSLPLDQWPNPLPPSDPDVDPTPQAHHHPVVLSLGSPSLSHVPQHSRPLPVDTSPSTPSFELPPLTPPPPPLKSSV